MAKIKSLFICGCCGKDTRKTNEKTEKVIVYNRANMLCPACKICLEEDIDNIAKRYLSKPQKPQRKNENGMDSE